MRLFPGFENGITALVRKLLLRKTDVNRQTMENQRK
jgi:hypothetical protein